MCPKHLQKKKPRMWMGLCTDSNWIQFSLLLPIDFEVKKLKLTFNFWIKFKINLTSDNRMNFQNGSTKNAFIGLFMLIIIHGPLMTIHRSGVCYISTWYTELTELHC